MRRFATCAGYDRVDAFRHAISLREIGTRSEIWRWERLAQYSGLPVSDLLVMRWGEIDGLDNRRAVQFMGAPLRLSHLVCTSMRFCPHCLREDREDEQRILRSFWSVRMATACTRHHNLLVDACHICGDQFEFRRKTKNWKCGCGLNMTDVATTTAPRGAVAISAMLAKLIGPERAVGHSNNEFALGLHDDLDRLSLDDLASVVQRIGTLAGSTAETDPHLDNARVRYRENGVSEQLNLAQSAFAADLAFNIIQDWPAGFEKLIADLNDRNPTPKVKHKALKHFATEAGIMLFDRLRRIDGSFIGVLDDVFRRWLLRQYSYRWGMRVEASNIRHKQQREHAMKITGEREEPDLVLGDVSRTLRRRANRLIAKDCFAASGKITALLTELWPTRTPLDPLLCPEVRTMRQERVYGKRNFPRNLHSIKDSIAVMSTRYGPPCGLDDQVNPAVL